MELGDFDRNAMRRYIYGLYDLPDGYHTQEATGGTCMYSYQCCMLIHSVIYPALHLVLFMFAALAGGSHERGTVSWLEDYAATLDRRVYICPKS